MVPVETESVAPDEYLLINKSTLKKSVCFFKESLTSHNEIGSE